MTRTPEVVGAGWQRGYCALSLFLWLSAILLLLQSRAVAGELFSMASRSMEPTLLVGDHFFIGPRIRSEDDVARGDVVAFEVEAAALWVHRVIGLPGDRVQLRQGRLYINDVLVPRELLVGESGPCQAGRMAQIYREVLPGGREHLISECGDWKAWDETRVFEVPPRHYFVLGDNRDNALDSRASQLGFVPFEHLVGRVDVVLLSVKDGAPYWEVWRWPDTLRKDRLWLRIQ